MDELVNARNQIAGNQDVIEHLRITAERIGIALRRGYRLDQIG
jgi:hypothetical protein